MAQQSRDGEGPETQLTKDNNNQSNTVAPILTQKERNNNSSNTNNIRNNISPITTVSTPITTSPSLSFSPSSIASNTPTQHKIIRKLQRQPTDNYLLGALTNRRSVWEEAEDISSGEEDT